MGKRVRWCGKVEGAHGRMPGLDLDGPLPLTAFDLGGRSCCVGDLRMHDMATQTGGYFGGIVVERPPHGDGFDTRTGQAPRFPRAKASKTFPITIMGEDLFADVE